MRPFSDNERNKINLTNINNQISNLILFSDDKLRVRRMQNSTDNYRAAFVSRASEFLVMNRHCLILILDSVVPECITYDQSCCYQFLINLPEKSEENLELPTA